MAKYVEFKNVAALKTKLNKLETIIEANKAKIREYLTLKNIPYTVDGDGWFGIDSGELTNEALQEYTEAFKDMHEATKLKFKELGVVYVDSEGYLDIKINLETRKN